LLGAYISGETAFHFFDSLPEKLTLNTLTPAA